MGVTIICDTRQQAGKHEHKNEWWGREGVSTIRSKLAFGDYALPPVVSVDSKKDIQELASNISQQHDRFKRECIAARDAGCQLVILVENTEGVRSLADLSFWQESQESFMRRKRAVLPLDGMRLAKACQTMTDRYGVRFEFCRPEESAKRIVEILMGGAHYAEDGSA